MVLSPMNCWSPLPLTIRLFDMLLSFEPDSFWIDVIQPCHHSTCTPRVHHVMPTITYFPLVSATSSMLIPLFRDSQSRWILMLRCLSILHPYLNSSSHSESRSCLIHDFPKFPNSQFHKHPYTRTHPTTQTPHTFSNSPSSRPLILRI